jgi:hypothetical protein
MTNKTRLIKALGLPGAKLSLFELVWLFAPIAIWFSYRPLLRLGQNTTMNFELSITVMYATVLALASLPIIWRSRRQLLRVRSVQLVTFFVFVTAVSVLWSANATRGILTFGLVGVLYAIFLATIADQKRLRAIVPALTTIFIFSAVVMSVLAFVQVFAGVWLDRSQTLLCAGCSAIQFGFARPNVFTVEPQFFGNLLLVPAVILLRRVLIDKQKPIVYTSSIIIISAIFLSLSRGAIFAFGVGLLVLLAVERPSIKRFLRFLCVMILSFLIGLLTQGFAAVLNPTVNTSFAGATSASINQLSLGLIDIQVQEQQLVPTNSTNPVPTTSATQPSATDQEVSTNFDGYVPESTNVRLLLSRLSLQSWSRTLERAVFGVGLGGSGVVLRNDFPSKVNNREIVQNEYVEVLLENGIIGMLLFIAIIAGLFWHLRQTKWLWAILVMFLIQWNFFSGYPNALHIYLVFMLLIVFGSQNAQRRQAQGKTMHQSD